MSDIYYTHSFKPNSSAIEAVYYNDQSRELLVKPRKGESLAGYYDVSPEAFRDFQNADSAGRFWVYEVKGTYPGFDTNGMNPVSAWGYTNQNPQPGIDEAVREGNLTPEQLAFVDSIRNPKPVENVTQATILPVNPPAPTQEQRRFDVTVEVTTRFTHTVYADNLDEALRIAQEDQPVEGTVKVVSATQFFN